MTGAPEPPPDPRPPPVPAPGEAYYRLLPGVEVVPVGDDVVLASDGVTLRLEGESAALFRDRVLALLDGTRTLDQVTAELPGVRPDDLRPHLDALVRARVLGRRDEPSDGAPVDGPGAARPLLRFLETVGLSPEQVAERLDGLRVAVVGLNGPGAHVAAVLAASGVGTVVLADPFPLGPADLQLMAPTAAARAGGAARHDVVREALGAAGGSGRLEVMQGDALDRGVVADLVAGSDLAVGCFDKGFSAAHAWLNEAGLDLGVDTLYAQLRGPTAWVGPLVVPGETACWLCWRMRAIASQEDFLAAMAVEEHLDGRRRPALAEAGALPALSPLVGGMVGLEAVKHLLGLGRDALAGHVHEVDALAGRTEVHAVLAVPDCPACSPSQAAQKKSPLAPTSLSPS
ncbi:MAG: TOMM precursor leader peptide-binding protein [Acidimicrobiales bacterium]